MKKENSIGEIEKIKRKVQLWNEMSDKEDGRINYLESENRFRYRKKIDGVNYVVSSMKSLKDVQKKMQEKGTQLKNKTITKNLETVEIAITDFYYNEYITGFAGVGKRRKERKKTTLLRTYVIIKKQIIETPFGKMKMKDLTLNILKKHLQSISKEVSYSTLKKVYEILNLFFNYLDNGNEIKNFQSLLRADCMPKEYFLKCKLNNLTDFNKVDQSKCKKKEKVATKILVRENAKRTVCALVGEDYLKFIEICKRPYVNDGKFIKGESGYLWGPLVIILAETGMRYGEMAALEWRDVDLNDKRVVIKKNYQNISDIPIDFSNDNKTKRTGLFTTPKTRSSRRVINLSDLAFESFMYYHNLRTSDEENCFLTSNKNIVSSNQIRKTVMRILYEMELYVDYDEIDKSKDNTLGSQMLRHSYATRRLVEGIPPLVIASELGHENTEMIESIYINLSSDIILLIK